MAFVLEYAGGHHLICMSTTTMARRNTQEELIMLKKTILDKYIAKEMTRKDAGHILKMHPNAVSRLKKNYLEHGIPALVPKKPGPKSGSVTHNRTTEEVEDVVIALALTHRHLGPEPLADRLYDAYGIVLNQTTVWRILKRKQIRYTRTYKRWKQDPTLYCLDKPGKELQMDGSYPYGRQRDIVHFDAIDDCSRLVYAKIYEHEDAESAISFVSHLIQNVPFRIEAIRVDNRYGKRFRVFCETLGIRVIENDPYCPQQNGKIERFHRTVKEEFYRKHCSFHDPKETLQYKLNLYLQYYNTKRRHGGFGMHRMTPTQKIVNTMLHSLALAYPQKVTSTLQQYSCCVVFTMPFIIKRIT